LHDDFFDSCQIHANHRQIVRKGDLLFTIDKRPFQNTVAQTQGTLAQAKANLAFAEADLDRAKQLVTNRTLTEQAFDQRTQAFRAATASVAANEAAVLPADPDAGPAALEALGVTDRSLLGALAVNTGGLAVDHGWLRVLGGPSLLEWRDRLDGGFVVGHDVVAGFYAVDQQEGEVRYLAPETLEWVGIEMGHSELTAMPSLANSTLMPSVHIDMPNLAMV